MGFSGSGVSFPELNLVTAGILDVSDINTLGWFEYRAVSVGENVFGPGDMNSPTGFGFDMFQPIQNVTQSRQSGGGNSTTPTSAAGGGSASSDL